MHFRSPRSASVLAFAAICLMLGLRAAGLKHLAPDESMLLVTEMDSDGDGYIDLAEFQAGKYIIEKVCWKPSINFRVVMLDRILLCREGAMG